MDDISVYGGSFKECLINLETVLHRCIEKNCAELGKMSLYGQPWDCAGTCHI